MKEAEARLKHGWVTVQSGNAAIVKYRHIFSKATKRYCHNKKYMYEQSFAQNG